MKKTLFYTTPPEGFLPTIHGAVCWIELKGKLLFLQTRLGKWGELTWSLPGGKIEPGETPLKAVIREVVEETQIELDEAHLKYSGVFFFRNPEIDYALHFFKVNLNGDFPKVATNPNEHIDFRWMSLEEALQFPIIEGGAECLKWIQSSMPTEDLVKDSF